MIMRREEGLSPERNPFVAGTIAQDGTLRARQPDVMEVKPLILIVDDEAELASTGAYTFEQEGLATEHVETGRGALDAIAAGPVPDLILLDLMLPDLVGTEVCR